jgi:phytoene dehydrogenase-like protein
MTFFWGLKKNTPLLIHNIFLADPIKKNYKEVINNHSLPKTPHFYVHAPVDTKSVVVHVPIGHIDKRQKQDWDEMKAGAREYVLSRLRCFGVDIEKMIKFEASGGPTFYQNHLNMTYGSAIGLHHNLFQMGYFRPHRQDSKYKNLYFVGSNTHPGCGVPSVLLSSMFTCERILKGR